MPTSAILIIEQGTSVFIGAFDKQIAENFIKDIFKSNDIEVDRKVIEAIIDTVGTLIPIYLQINVIKLRDRFISEIIFFRMWTIFSRKFSTRSYSRII